MTEFIIAGGPFMWPLLACSILIITISIERLWFLQIRLVSPKGLTNQIVNLFNKNLINNKQADEISELSSLGFLLISCIQYKDLPRENLESKIEEKAVEIKYSLERNLNMLGTIATISPLLGLLGTVIGMIAAFTGLSEVTGANPDALAAGISQALITTAFGLFIAVPGLVLHKYFEQKVSYLLITLQIEVSRFITSPKAGKSVTAMANMAAVANAKNAGTKAMECGFSSAGTNDKVASAKMLEMPAPTAASVKATSTASSTTNSVAATSENAPDNMTTANRRCKRKAKMAMSVKSEMSDALTRKPDISRAPVHYFSWPSNCQESIFTIFENGSTFRTIAPL